MITITLLGTPVSTNVVYRRHGNIMYMSKEGKELKESYRDQAHIQWHRSLITDPVTIEIYLYFKDKRRRDIDNWHKILLDSLTGVIWDDDSQIIEMTVKKFIDPVNPRIEVKLAV
jgi:crossover junction endodeoxyribonuclease RusA